MVVRAGREFLAIPGPTNHADEVLRAMHRPALDIYSHQMVEMTDSLLRDLSNCLPPGPLLHLYRQWPRRVGSPLSNVLSRGDKCWCWKAAVCHRLGQRRGRMGADVEVLKGDCAAHPAERGRSPLRKDKDHTIKAILAVQVDTASRRIQRHRSHGKAIKAAGHPRCSCRCGGVAGLHAVRDGWPGASSRDSRLAKRPDGPPGLASCANDRPRGAKTAGWDALLGWTDREPASITGNMPAQRQ